MRIIAPAAPSGAHHNVRYGTVRKGLASIGCALAAALLMAVLPAGLAGAQEVRQAPPTAPAVQPQPAPPAAAPNAAPAEPASAAAAQPAQPPAAPAIASLPHDLSPWSMFQQADIVVKAVMVGLAFASLVTWTVWLAKGLELFGANRKAKSAARKLTEADSLHQAARAIEAGWTRSGSVADLIQAAVQEARRSADLSPDGIKERVSIALSRIEARAGRAMARGTGLLATIGATAPFVGLFGTVWGIMNSFIGISQSKTTNLAVVAPGIAEALLATAIGLVAAIPAVIIYNVFARAIAGYRALLTDASGEVLRHLSRDLERHERTTAGSHAVSQVAPLRAAAPALRPAE